MSNFAMDSRPAVIQEIEKTTSEKVYSKLSTSDLSKELAESVLKEEERYNIDEMKKRAIHVSRSYDEFRQMVLCANLKPMKSKELEDLGNSRMSKRAFTYGTAANGTDTTTTGRFRRRTGATTGVTNTTKKTTSNNSSSPSSTPSTSSPTTSPSTSSDPALTSITERARARARAKPKPVGPGLSKKRRMPKNRSEFQRDWQRNCKTTEQQQEYLREVGAKRLKKLFAAGYPSGMLGLLLDTLYAECSQENFDSKDTFVVDILKVLKSATGFSMETMFLSTDERERVAETLILIHADDSLKEAFKF